jgi:hypothetical protein
MSLTGCHKSGSSYISCENIGLTFLGKSLDDWVADSHRVQHAALKLGQLFALLNTCLFPVRAESKDLTSLDRGALITRSQVGELVKSLLRKVLNHLPFRLNLVWWISHAAALPVLLLAAIGLVGSGDVCSPLLLLFRLLWTREVRLYVGFVLLSRDLILSLLACCLGLLALILLYLTLIFNSVKAEIFGSFDQLGVLSSLHLQLGATRALRLQHLRLLRLFKASDCVVDYLGAAEFNQFADFLFFVVRLEKSAIKLVSKVYGLVSGAETKRRTGDLEVLNL